MEPQELSLALLQPQVTVVATLGELLDTLPRLEEMVLLLESALRLYRDLKEFTWELWASQQYTDDSWRRYDFTFDDADSVIILSRALAAYKSRPWPTWDQVTMVASKWQGSVAALECRWAWMAGAATELHKTCREVVNEVTSQAATATARARELQGEAARDGTALENMVELRLALDEVEGAEVVAEHEAPVRKKARVAASEATRATMVRQRLEAALGLLERLVAACDEATAFPRELQRRVGDIKTALEGTNEASRDVPEDLVAKVAKAEQLWEANARLAKDHLVGTLEDIIKFHFDGGPASPSACGVAKRCLRAMEDISRLLRVPECPQGVPKVSPVSVEPQKVFPLQLQVLVAVVATLGEVVATVTEPWRAKCLRESPVSLHEDLKRFTQSLCRILDHGHVTSLGHPGVTSLGRALAALRATPGTTWANVRAVASAWQDSVAKLVDSWDWLAREATKLHEKVVMAQQLMVALDTEEMAWDTVALKILVVATSEAMEETVEAGMGALAASRLRHWAEVALGPLQRLVATCDRATLFNWSMECQLRDIEAILKGTIEVSPDVLQALWARVAQFERLWEASAHLAKGHLLGTLGDIHNILLSPWDGPVGPSRYAVAEQYQKAIEDIPRLLQESVTWGQ